MAAVEVVAVAVVVVAVADADLKWCRYHIKGNYTEQENEHEGDAYREHE